MVVMTCLDKACSGQKTRYVCMQVVCWLKKTKFGHIVIFITFKVIYVHNHHNLLALLSRGEQ